MRYAIVQENRSLHALVIKLASSLEALLEIEFQFDATLHPPRVHKLEDANCINDASIVRCVRAQKRRGDYTTLHASSGKVVARAPYGRAKIFR